MPSLKIPYLSPADIVPELVKVLIVPLTFFNPNSSSAEIVPVSLFVSVVIVPPFHKLESSLAEIVPELSNVPMVPPALFNPKSPVNALIKPIFVSVVIVEDLLYKPFILA